MIPRAFAVGGLLNATCGNATELIIALFALMEGKIEVVKCSLLGSVLSNLLLVLGTSLFCGGIKNLHHDQPYDRVTTVTSYHSAAMHTFLRNWSRSSIIFSTICMRCVCRNKRTSARAC